MDVKRVIKSRNLRFFLQIILLSFLSANTYSSPLPLARPLTHADTGHTMPTVISSNPAVATATISGTTVIPGVHTLLINSLAEAEQLVSKTYPNQTTPLSIAETLTIMVGHSTIAVEIELSDSLQSIVSKVNSAAKVAHLNTIAYVVATNPNEYLLLIGSTQTGNANTISISESGINENKLDISKVLTSAKNATFTLDGLAYSTSSNNNIIGEWLVINFNSVGQVTLTVNDI